MTLHQKLKKAKTQNKLPQITVYNRIDGPGSSLDLRLFQQSMWELGKIPSNPLRDKSMKWSIGYPRTIGIAINVGTEITAEPIQSGKLGVESIDFGFCYILDKDAIPPTKEHWLLRIMANFNLDGIKFTLRNLHPELKSAGLGGSAAVTTGVALLCNRLSRKPFSQHQIIGLASMLEQDLEVSITGTQEQSNAVFGGVRDYIWFPFGIPGTDNFFGTSIRQEIMPKKDYKELEARIDLYFALQRQSTDVNSKWYEELRKPSGYKLHSKKCSLAYEYREAIRTKNWKRAVPAISEYRKIRTKLCSDYMSDEAWEIEKMCRRNNAVSFPLGGGGGTIMVFSPSPKNLEKMRPRLSERFRHIDYKILAHGHKFRNISGF
ncbi:GHMP kinase [bacterium]|nr:GHMP kinase [bacterium]|tara:strand:+ start:5425 stop:6552 length:1128 start_codon:yes stop_codon:yes gene_type:complete